MCLVILVASAKDGRTDMQFLIFIFYLCANILFYVSSIVRCILFLVRSQSQHFLPNCLDQAEFVLYNIVHSIII